MCPTHYYTNQMSVQTYAGSFGMPYNVYWGHNATWCCEAIVISTDTVPVGQTIEFLQVFRVLQPD